jgi:hypothetical protein
MLYRLALCLLLALGCFAQPKTFDYTTTGAVTLSSATSKWTLQLPTTATRTARLKSIQLVASGGASSDKCAFTTLRDTTIATATTALTVTKVSTRIANNTVPPPQATAYSASNASGGTAFGGTYRLSSDFDHKVIQYDSKFLSAGDTVTVVATSCTGTFEVMFVHEEF